MSNSTDSPSVVMKQDGKRTWTIKSPNATPREELHAPPSWEDFSQMAAEMKKILALVSHPGTPAPPTQPDGDSTASSALPASEGKYGSFGSDLSGASSGHASAESLASDDHQDQEQDSGYSGSQHRGRRNQQHIKILHDEPFSRRNQTVFLAQMRKMFFMKNGKNQVLPIKFNKDELRDCMKSLYNMAREQFRSADFLTTEEPPIVAVDLCANIFNLLVEKSAPEVKLVLSEYPNEQQNPYFFFQYHRNRTEGYEGSMRFKYTALLAFFKMLELPKNISVRDVPTKLLILQTVRSNELFKMYQPDMALHDFVREANMVMILAILQGIPHWSQVADRLIKEVLLDASTISPAWVLTHRGRVRKRVPCMTKTHKNPPATPPGDPPGPRFFGVFREL
jgi:hypothetical protein